MGGVARCTVCRAPTRLSRSRLDYLRPPRARQTAIVSPGGSARRRCGELGGAPRSPGTNGADADRQFRVLALLADDLRGRASHFLYELPCSPTTSRPATPAGEAGYPCRASVLRVFPCGGEEAAALVLDDVHTSPPGLPSRRLLEAVCRQSPWAALLLSAAAPPFPFRRLRQRAELLEFPPPTAFTTGYRAAARRPGVTHSFCAPSRLRWPVAADDRRRHDHCGCLPCTALRTPQLLTYLGTIS